VIPFINQSRSRSRRGSILVVVLAIVMLLSVMVVAFMDEALQQLRYSSLYQNQDDLRQEAYEALEVTGATLAIFQEVEEHLWGPAQGWGDPLEFADYRPPEGIDIKVRLVEESSRIPFNTLDYDQLVELFTYLGIPEYLANDAADSYIDWTDEDDLKRLNGFDGDDYERLDPPIRAANRKSRNWDELELIPAIKEAFWDEETDTPTGAWRQLQDIATLRYEGPVNINTAPSDVLYAMEELQILDAREIIDYRDGWNADRSDDDRYYREVSSAPVTETSMASTEVGQLWVEITASRGDAQFVLTALLQLSGSSQANGQNGGDEADEGGGDGQDQDQSADEADSADEDQSGQNAEDSASEEDNGTQDTASDETQNQSSKSTERFPFSILRLQENAKIGWTEEKAANFNDGIE